MNDIKAKDVLSKENKPVYRKSPKVSEIELGEKFNDEVVAFIQFLANEKRTKDLIKSYVKDHLEKFYSANNIRHSYFRISAVLQEYVVKKIMKLLMHLYSKPTYKYFLMK